MKKRLQKYPWLPYGLAVAVLALGVLRYRQAPAPENRPLNELAAMAPSEVRRVEIEIVDEHTRRYHVHRRDGSVREYTAPVEMVSAFLTRAEQAGIPLVVEHKSIWKQFVGAIDTLFTLLILAFFTKDYWGKRFSPLTKGERPKTTFADIGGYPDVKAELGVLVAQLRNPGKVHELGGRPPRGVLLSGVPGTGKTHLARALAGEASVPFFQVSGSGFVQMFAGLGAKRVRDLFAAAKRAAPCIIFIDEIDAIGRKRDTGGSGSSEDLQTINELLAAMDGFEPNSGVIVIGATNNPDSLDPALLRPGRFDRKVQMILPDLEGRLAILRTIATSRKLRLEANVDLAVFARCTSGFSGAALDNLLNEATLLAASAGDNSVTRHHLDQAFDRITMGLRSSLVMGEVKRRAVAIHEAGHAIVARYVPGAPAIGKLTVVPHGEALGMLVHEVGEESFMSTRRELMARLAVLLGGRIAEEHVLGMDEVSNSASNDLEQATRLAYEMAFRWGFTPRTSTQDGASHTTVSRSVLSDEADDDETIARFSRNMEALIQEARAMAEGAIRVHEADHRYLVHALLERETLTSQEIDALLEDAPAGSTAGEAVSAHGSGV